MEPYVALIPANISAFISRMDGAKCIIFVLQLSTNQEELIATIVDFEFGGAERESNLSGCIC